MQLCRVQSGFCWVAAGLVERSQRDPTKGGMCVHLGLTVAAWSPLGRGRSRSRAQVGCSKLGQKAPICLPGWGLTQG